ADPLLPAGVGVNFAHATPVLPEVMLGGVTKTDICPSPPLPARPIVTSASEAPTVATAASNATSFRPERDKTPSPSKFDRTTAEHRSSHEVRSKSREATVANRLLGACRLALVAPADEVREPVAECLEARGGRIEAAPGRGSLLLRVEELRPDRPGPR